MTGTSVQAGGRVRRHAAAQPGKPPRQRRRLRNSQQQLFAALAFLAPALVTLIALRLIPAGQAVSESLFHESVLQGTREFVGLENYLGLFTDPGFLNSLGVTLLFSLIVNPLQVGVAFCLAVLYTRKAAASGFWRTLVILPIAAPTAVSAVIWSAIYRPDGLANSFLHVLGLPPQPFLTSPDQALFSVIVLLSWTGVGYWMLFLIAGINDIPEELYEAASIDGASAARKLFRITLPLVRRPMAFVLVATTTANFLVFAPIQILTNGGPNGSTNLLMYEIYNRAFTLGDINRAQAAVVLLILINLIVVIIQFRLMREKE